MSPRARASLPAVFLDRDGTLVEDTHYPSDPDEVRLIRGVPEALRLLRDAGYRLVVVTNQSGLARGLVTPSQYRAVAARVNSLLDAAGSRVDATFFCPHHPEFSGLGLHREAARKLRIDLSRSWYVGDKASDVLPALEAGGRGVLVRTGKGAEVEASGGLPEGIEVVDDLLAAAGRIRAADGTSGGPGSR